MIGTIRKHSKWLLWVIAGLTIASFVLFMGAGPARFNNGGSSGVNTNLVGGKIYGETVTPDLYTKMDNDVKLYYLFGDGEWPDRIPGLTQDELLRNIYVRMMMVEKAKQLGIHVSDTQAAQAAANYLHSPRLLHALGASGESVPFNAFRDQVLAPEGLTADDFENFVRDDLAVEQLQQIFGIPGELVTPQEAAEEYVRANREYSAQIIFFSASNYLDRVSVSPAEVGLFYTNYMADYRLPDRRQVSYVLFSVTNYLGQALKEIGSSNLDFQVQGAYEKYGMKATPDATTPEEAKAEIRKIILKQQALANAVTQADVFAQSVFNVSSTANKPASADDLFAIARQEGLTVKTPAPFSSDYGPSEFTAPAAFTQTAFSLGPDTPISEPVPTQDGVYVIALKSIMPSEIPPLEEIRSRVADDLRLREATMLAQRVGTNFMRTLNLQMASGKSFAAAGIADGLETEVLPTFSLSTQDLPELGDRATINQLKEAAFSTPVGTASRFAETQDGGFILYVSSRPPIDESKMTAELPQFTAELRERRIQDAFNQWLQLEGGRELRDTPLARLMQAR
jgi:parvulin-like peptidyl-prolyl isomerase